MKWIVVGAIVALAAQVLAQDGPRVRVLGTVQDGGLPHAACNCVRCDAARQNPQRARTVACLGVIVPGAERELVYLIDATPDIRIQIDRLADVRDAPDGRVDRSPVDGVLLTHAHIGHYTGLTFFGFEAVHTQRLPVMCTERMASFLRDNGPWSQLVEIGNIELSTSSPWKLGSSVETGIVARAFHVPHRDEYSDTVGFLLTGPTQTLLYVPDTEPWSTWETPLPDVLEQHDIDIAILDGTFYSADELPGRAVSSIGHPLIIDTMDLLKPALRAGELQVHFTHLNHSNPALDPASDEAGEIKSRGFHVLQEDIEFDL